jgi:protein SCO1/2
MKLLAVVVVAGLALSDGIAGEKSRLAVIKAAPDFALQTQDGQTLRRSDLQGKVLLVSFIFTTCNGSCPATTHRMSDVQQELKKRGLDKDGSVHLLSISLDPAHDTPEALRGYMRLYNLSSAGWSFLTGAPEQVAKTITAWGMWVRPAANGQLDHPSRIFLVDQAGRIREIYNLNFFKPSWVAEDVELQTVVGCAHGRPARLAAPLWERVGQAGGGRVSVQRAPRRERLNNTRRY